MAIKHHYQSGRGDNGDPGAIQPSHWDADHDLTGMLALLDAVAPTPNVVFTLDGAGNFFFQATASFAPTYSAQLTGVPTAPTALQTVNSTQIATTEYVRTAITNLVGGAPGALDTLNELATAINDDASFAATVTSALAVRLRVDAAQGLNETQKAQGQSNLGLGTAALYNVGTGANNVVQLDGSSKLPAVDGSQLTNIVFAGAVRYDQVMSITADQKAVAVGNIGSVPFNGQIVESHAAGAVTFAVKTPSGADPSATTPVVFRFPTGGGAYTFVSVTAALSITIPSGATLGQSNAQAFRLWLAAFNDAGTVRLAARTCMALTFTGSSPNYTIISPVETRPASSTLTPGNSAHTFYTTGAAVTTKYWEWIAHATYEAGLATAGTWNVSPDFIALVDPSTRRPGAVIQDQVNPTVQSFAPSDTATHTLSTQTVTPSSAANVFDIEADGYIYLRQGVSGEQGSLYVARGSTNVQPANTTAFQIATTDAIWPARPRGFDKPNTTAAVTYNIICQNVTSGTANYQSWNLRIREIVT
ncbi:hypothetical protein CWO91_34815 [Bradyrhizobium genosp. SA-3]|uniref:hypothetical protein n=1 Tax=Bradyrhizobium genosp. SA-3 TaxID=508868 RepID=UPI0010290AA6|nr:hypothetical protein [Bradyrhizobium genosp. SA-3]RZM99946.1 hypothetical protein CWO91_34815 [Bradyrhizobium genosp. SA-3]